MTVAGRGESRDEQRVHAVGVGDLLGVDRDGEAAKLIQRREEQPAQHAIDEDADAHRLTADDVVSRRKQHRRADETQRQGHAAPRAEELLENQRGAPDEHHAEDELLVDPGADGDDQAGEEAHGRRISDGQR